MKIPKAIPLKVPLLGSRGLLTLLGLIVGILFKKFLMQIGQEHREWLGGNPKLFTGFWLDDLIAIGTPLILFIFIKRFKAFFFGMFLGAVSVKTIAYLYNVALVPPDFPPLY